MIRRHKLLFLAIGAVAAALLIGLVVSTWLFFKAVKARGLARQRQLWAESQMARVTARTAGWSRRAESLAHEAAKIHTGENTGEARDQTAAAFAGLDAQRTQHFTNFGASSVLFDREGRRLLMGSLGDGTKLWDGANRQSLIVPNSQRSPVAFVDGVAPAQLLYDTNRHAFILSNLLNAQPLRDWKIPSEIFPRMKTGAQPKILALSPEGSVAVAVLEMSDGKEAVLAFRLDSSKLLQESSASKTAAAISPDGQLLATAEAGGRVEVWSLESGQPIAAMASGRNEILCLALKSVPRTSEAKRRGETPNVSWLLAAGDAGGDVTIYDVQAGALMAQCRGGHYQVFSLAFSPDGAALASGGRGPVKVWDVATGKPLLDISMGDYITGLDFTPDGSRLAVSTAGITAAKNVSVWNLEYGRGIQSLCGLSGQISKVCFSADGRRLAAMSHKWEIGVWDVVTGQLLRVVEAPMGFLADNAALALSPGGEQLAFASWKTARLWEVQTGRELGAWDLPEGIADVMAFSGVNRLVLLRMETLDGKVAPLGNSHPKDHPRVCRIRDLLGPLATQPFAEIRDFNWHVFDAAPSPDGRFFVVEGMKVDDVGGRILTKAFDGLTGRELWTVGSARTNGAGALIADASGKYVVFQTNHSSAAVMFELSSGKLVKTLPWPPSTFCSEFGLFVCPGRTPIHERGCSLSLSPAEIPALTLGIDQTSIDRALFDSTGRRLAWGNTDGTVTVCNLKEINERLAGAKLQW